MTVVKYSIPIDRYSGNGEMRWRRLFLFFVSFSLHFLRLLSLFSLFVKTDSSSVNHMVDQVLHLPVSLAAKSWDHVNRTRPIVHIAMLTAFIFFRLILLITMTISCTSSLGDCGFLEIR